MKNLIAGIIILLFSTNVSGQVSWRLIQQGIIHIFNGDTLSTAVSGYYYDADTSKRGLPPENPMLLYSQEDQYPTSLFPYINPVEYDSNVVVIKSKAQQAPIKQRAQQSFYPDGKISEWQLYQERNGLDDWGLYQADSFYYTGNNLTLYKRYQVLSIDINKKVNWGVAHAFGYVYDTNNRPVQKLEWLGDNTAGNLSKVRFITYNTNGLIIQDSSSHKVTEYANGTSQVVKEYWKVFRNYYYTYDSVTNNMSERILLSNPFQDTFEFTRYAYDANNRLISDSTFQWHANSGQYKIAKTNNYHYNNQGHIIKQDYFEPNTNHPTALHDIHINFDFFYNTDRLLVRMTQKTYSEYLGSSVYITDYKYCRVTENCKPDLPAILPAQQPNTITIYPNPAVKFIHIAAVFSEETYIRINISTLTGLNILRVTDNSVTSYKKQIPVGNIPPGIYLVTVETKYERVTKRIMIL